VVLLMTNIIWDGMLCIGFVVPVLSKDHSASCSSWDHWCTATNISAYPAVLSTAQSHAKNSSDDES